MQRDYWRSVLARIFMPTLMLITGLTSIRTQKRQLTMDSAKWRHIRHDREA